MTSEPKRFGDWGYWGDGRALRMRSNQSRYVAVGAAVERGVVAVLVVLAGGEEKRGVAG
jgi:hypothetical protein